MKKTITLLLFLLMLGAIVYGQNSKRTTNENLSMKTARLHIDGFMKSKSGAV